MGLCGSATGAQARACTRPSSPPLLSPRTYYNNGSISGSGPPIWDYNAQPSFVVNVTATDPVTSLSAARSYLVSLSHANRPPSWTLPIPEMVTPALTSGLVGPPLLQYVSDPDLLLSVGENETFSITGGNLGGTFAVVPTTGQLFVANNLSSNFQFGQPNFTLTVSVTDAGVNGPRYTAWANVSIVVSVARPAL